MESANDKYSTEHKLDFKEYYRRLRTLRSNLNSAFLESEKINREALNNLEFQYSTLQSKLQDKFNSSKNLLNEITRKGEKSKELFFEKIKKFSERLNFYEVSFGDIKHLTDESRNLVMEEFNDIQNIVEFTEVSLKYTNPEIFSGEFGLSYLNEDKNYRVRWFFVDPDEMVEREFTKSIQKQLEEGFLGVPYNNKKSINNDQLMCALQLKSGKVFGQAYFDSMIMTTQYPKKTFNLVRQQL